jgi:hypothetical protein
MSILTRSEIIKHLYGTLAMCDGSLEIGHSGGKRRQEMQRYLTNQIACRIMELQEMLETSELLGDTSLKENK